MIISQSFSIIIPHHVSSPHLEEVLHSLANQTYSKKLFEIILVVDGVSNQSVSYTFPQELNQVTVLQQGEWLGTAEAKNRGAERAQNEWLIFLDDDMCLHETWLAEMSAAIVKNKERFIFQSKVLSYENPNYLRSAGGVANVIGYAWDRGIGELDEGQYDSEQTILFPSSCAMMISKKIFSSAGGFDSDIFYMGEDYELGLRLAQKGHETCFVPSAKAYHKEQSPEYQNNLNKKYYLERSRHITLLKNYSFIELLKYFPLLFVVKIYKYGRYLFSFKNRRRHAKNTVAGLFSVRKLFKNIKNVRKTLLKNRKKSIDQVFGAFPEYKYQVRRAGEIRS